MSKPDPSVRLHLTRGALEFVAVILCYMQIRSLVAVQDPREIVVLYAPDCDVDATRQEVAVLNSLGLGPHPQNVWVVDANGEGTQLMNPHVPVRMRDLDGDTVDTFTNVSHDGMLRRLLGGSGLELKGSTEAEARSANDKGCFLDIAASDPACNIPRGWSLNRDGVIDTLRDTELLGDDQCYWLKPVHGASGEGHQWDLREIDDLKSLEPGFNSWVLQRQVLKSFDASVQFAIVNGELYGDLQVLGQHVDGAHHLGNNTLNGKVPDWVINHATRQVRRLIKKHYSHLQHGVGSVDIVVWLGGHGVKRQVYLIELNWRWTAPRYAIQALERLYGCDNGLHWDMKSFKIPSGMSLSSIVEIMGMSSPDDFERRSAYVPFCYIPSEQFCYRLVFAPTREELEAKLAEVCLKETVLARKARN